MYRYELEVINEVGCTHYVTIWADNCRDAQETGELMFPNARYIEVL